MGGGEAHYNRFYRWFSALESHEAESYARENPEPEPWKGFYEMIRSHPWR